MRLYNHYLPLAGDLQQLLIQELYTLHPVGEASVDTLFYQVERITGLYIKTGRSEEAMSDKWVNAAILRNLLERITKYLAVQ